MVPADKPATDLASDAAVALAARTSVDRHDVFVVLGSGWVKAADGLTGDSSADAAVEVAMADLPGFPTPSAPGHAGSFRSTTVAGLRVLLAMGRLHLYEGHSPATVAHAVRTAGAAGCRIAILTNAAGLMRRGRLGQIVVITDQINMTGESPLTGSASFVDLSDLYSRRLRAVVEQVEPGLATGVYVGTHGPEFESPAEIRAYGLLGADVVGMSTVLEAIAAHHLGMEVLGLSMVSNLAAGVGAAPLEADHFLAVGEANAADHSSLLVRIIERLDTRVTANPWLDRRVLCYAHQGGAREGPSSTLWTLAHAVANGADAIELDVHATADGHLVVCHDATVDRTTNSSGAIAAMTLDELRRLDNAYWWVPGEVVDHDRADTEYVLRGRAPADTSLCIATLEEVLDAFPDTLLNFDIKQTAPAVVPYEERLARALREHGRTGDVIVASFNDAATDAFRTVAPEIGTSAGTMAVAGFWRAAHQGESLPALPHVALQVPVTAAGLTVLDAVFVAAAHEQQLAVHAWTIDDPAEMATLVALGVDGIMSDVPSTVVEVLRGADARYRG